MKATTKNLKKLDFVKALNKLTPTERKTLIELLGDEAIDTICETIANICYNSNNQIKKKKRKLLCNAFKKKEKDIEKLSNRSIDVAKRRKILNKSQIGAGLGLVLSAALPLLSNLLFGHS